jgi:3-oxoacyl-[acyl-carrier-protein] synthase-3
MIRSVIRSTGSYLPARTLTNAEMERLVDTSDEWIVQRTGIRERHVAAENNQRLIWRLQAAKRALESSGLSPEDLDGVIVATTTPGPHLSGCGGYGAGGFGNACGIGI